MLNYQRVLHVPDRPYLRASCQDVWDPSLRGGSDPTGDGSQGILSTSWFSFLTVKHWDHNAITMGLS